MLRVYLYNIHLRVGCRIERPRRVARFTIQRGMLRASRRDRTSTREDLDMFRSLVYLPVQCKSQLYFKDSSNI